MNPAEHSPWNHSAPYGASPAAPTSNRNSSAFSKAGAPAVSPPAFRGQSASFLLSQRRSAASGRALIAVLALGLAIEMSPSAQAFPRVAGAPFLASDIAQTTSAPRATLTPRATAVEAPSFLRSTAVPQAKAAQVKVPQVKVPQAKAIKTAPTPAISTRAQFSPLEASQPLPPRMEPSKSKPSQPRAVQGMPVKLKTSQPGSPQLLLSQAMPAPLMPSPLMPSPILPRGKFSRVEFSRMKPLMVTPLELKAAQLKPFPLTQLALKTSQPRPREVKSLSFPALNSARIVRVAQAAQTVTRGGDLPLLPAAPDLKGMKKVIDVSSLSLPPLSKPLPMALQIAALKIDRLDAKNRARLAQNPAAAPVRNPGAPVTNSDRLPNQIEVAVSTFVVLLTTTDLQTVAVADPSIADVAVVNSRSVLLNGKAAGVTSLVIVDGQKIRQYTVRVTPPPGSRAIDVAQAIGLPGVSVRPLRDALVLEGEVASPEEARRAVEIAGIYATRVINQLTIRGQASPEAVTAASLRDLLNLPGVTVRMSGDTAILTGTVDTPQQAQEAEVIALTAAKKVLNLLKLPSMSVEQVRQSLGAVAEAPAATSLSPGQMRMSAPLSIREAGGQLIVEGVVGSQSEADVALAAANRTGLGVVNRLQIRAAATGDQALVAQVAAAIGRPGVVVRGTVKRLVLEGTVADTNEAVLAEQVARAFVTPGLGQVDNLLRTPLPVQCNVDVSIVELNTNDSRQLGVQLGSVSLVGETAGTPTTNPVTGAIIPGVTTRTINPTFNQGTTTLGGGFTGGQGFRVLDPFRARLNALIAQGRGRVLSNPASTVLSGRTATFQVGGQVPIPVGSSTNNNGTTTTIAFKNYGILLDIVPNALSNGNVTLRVRTEVSQPDFATGIIPPGGGGPIPGFRTRRMVTEVTVPANGTVALSGLITAEDTRNESSVPILSKLPIIGPLFRSRDFRQNKTELVIFVKPRVLPNTLGAGSDAFAGVVAVGENSNIAAVLGNPGLRTFDEGATTTGAAPAAQ